MAHGPAEELTGKRRYLRVILWSRKMSFHHRLVLQVEVSYWDYDKRGWAVKWRDATPADLPEGSVI